MKDRSESRITPRQRAFCLGVVVVPHTEREEEEEEEEDTLLASLDVEALYSNIRHDLGLKAIKYFLNTKGTQFSEHNDFVLQLLNFVLTHNYFLFDGTFYHQIKGTAMGTVCAPSFANLFLGWWEDAIVFSEHFEIFTDRILFWGRFIDDILIFWEGSEELFRDFVSRLNDNEIGMKFTFEIHREKINFLDLQIVLDENRQVQTTIFRKNTATNSLLHFSSWHPPSLKKGIPIGQFLRARRNCSTLEAFNQECMNLNARFQARGYPKKCLRKAFNRAVTSDRGQLLVSNRKEEAKTDLIRCIGTFDDRANEMRGILRRHWHILRADPVFSEVIPKYPSVTYRRGKNLRDELVHSHFEGDSKKTWLQSSVVGSYPCGNCSFCPFIWKTKEFVNPIDKRRFEIRQFINCKTRGVIYGAMCTCPKIYVGKTVQEFRRRISKHLSTIKTRGDTPLARHILEVHNGEIEVLKFWGICVKKLGERKGDLDMVLLQEEAKWIYRLNTLNPKGLNEGFSFSAFI